jgi:hypothetical protein
VSDDDRGAIRPWAWCEYRLARQTTAPQKEFTMTHQEQLEHGAESAPHNGITRRRLIATGATLAAAGVAVGAVGTLAASAVHDHVAAGSAGPAPEEQVMVHLQDANSGRLALFVGERKFVFTDHAVAAAMVKNAANAI